MTRIIGILSLALFSLSIAQTNEPMSARSFAMGLTSSCFNGDINLFNNPGQLAEIDRVYSSTTYSFQSVLQSDQHTLGISLAIPSRLGNFSILYSGYTMDNIIERSSVGIPTGTFSFKEKYLLLSYARALSENLFAGINIYFKTIEFLDNSYMYDPGIDISVHYNFEFADIPVSYSKVGIVIKNINQPIIPGRYYHDYLPRKYTLINDNLIEINDNSFITVFNIDYNENQGFSDDPFEYRFGLEYSRDFIRLRIGNNNGDFFTYGIGIIFLNFYLDYGFARFDWSYLDPVHKVTFGISL